jgi:hypothetical protein
VGLIIFEPAPYAMINPLTVEIPSNGKALSRPPVEISEEPFYLSSALHQEIESLGRILLQFYRSINLLYFQSVAGKMPRWISDLMDAGKPSWLVELQRHRVFKGALPRVIRPDLLLTEEGIRITELDSVPGGIGLLDSHAENLPRPGHHAEGLPFIFDEARPVKIIVSEESGSYRPEMEYLTRHLGPDRFQVVDEYHRNFPSGSSVYRFFELFDLENIPMRKRIV